MPFAKADAWRSDLDMLSDTLQERHIDLYHRVSKEAFVRELAEIKGRLDDVSEDEALVAVMRLIRRIGDGHTAIPLWDIPYTQFPFGISIVEGVPLVTATDDGHAALLGAELTAINGMPARDVMNRLAGIVPFVENVQSARVRTGALLMNTRLLHGLGVISDTAATDLTFLAGAETRVVRVLSLDKSDYGTAVIRTLDYRASNPFDPVYRYNDKFWFGASADKKSVYVRMDSYPPYSAIAEFGEEILGFIEQNQTRNLIIDLRENYGGDFFIGLHLASYLVLADSVDWRKGVYGLIGEKTFSAAMSNAVQFRQLLNARLIGQPTGANPCGYQDLGQFKLANTGLVVTYSKRRYCFEDHGQDTVKPDVTINVSVDDWRSGQDSVLEWVLQDAGIR